MFFLIVYYYTSKPIIFYQIKLHLNGLDSVHKILKKPLILKKINKK